MYEAATEIEKAGKETVKELYNLGKK